MKVEKIVLKKFTKINKNVLVLSVVTALLCGIWTLLSNVCSSFLLGWAGFAGCTSYFACGAHGMDGVKKTILPNLAGAVCGVLCINLGGLVNSMNDWGIWCAIFTFIMCYIAVSDLFSFCPGTFIGCFSVFAADGNWKLLVPSLILGAFLGLGCDMGTKAIEARLWGEKKRTVSRPTGAAEDLS